MGAIAEAMVAYVKPLLDQTDGSEVQVQRAFTIGQMCYNLALRPVSERDKTLESLRPALNMDDQMFAEFKRDVVLPMIRRHEEMFPLMHQRKSSRSASVPLRPPMQQMPRARTEIPSGIGRNSPCPCNSGRKYKHCCGRAA